MGCPPTLRFGCEPRQSIGPDAILLSDAAHWPSRLSEAAAPRYNDDAETGVRELGLSWMGGGAAGSNVAHAGFPEQSFSKVRAQPGRLSALSVSHSKSVLYGVFLWARRAF